MQALKRQKIEIDAINQNMLIVYDGMCLSDCLNEAKKHRACGVNVRVMKYDPSKTKDDYEKYAKNHSIKEILYLMDENN